MTKQLVLLVLVIFLCIESYSQSKSYKGLRGTYTSLWADTRWMYDFLSDSTYVYQTSGHFGNVNSKGKYCIVGDTVKLTAYPKELQEDPKFYFKDGFLLIENDSCLINLETGYEHLLRKDGNVIYASKKRNLKRKGMPVIKQQ